MRRIVVTARIFSDEGKPAPRHAVSVVSFSLASQRLETVAEGATNTSGFLRLEIDGGKFEGATAPAFRLVEKGSPATRVLSAGGMFRFDKRSDTLFIDFGEIERLEETAFKRPHSDATFARHPYQVAGVSKRVDVSLVAVERNFVAEPQLRATIGTVSKPTGTFTVSDSATATIAGNDQLLTGNQIAPVSKELDTLKAINLEKDAVIVRKDQDLIARTVELASVTTQLETTKFELAKEKTLSAAAAAKVADLERAKGVEADVQTVVTGLGTKLSAANQDLKAQALPFRIGTVKVDLRGKLTPDGGKIVLGGEDGASGSGVSTELHVDKGAGTADLTKVPNVVGLTESAARRVLRSVGLRMKAASQTLPANSGTPGQAMTQHPASGADVAHGGEVLVVFGIAGN